MINCEILSLLIISVYTMLPPFLLAVGLTCIFCAPCHKQSVANVSGSEAYSHVTTVNRQQLEESKKY